MKLIILAGGMGSRLIEETENRPKPMIEVGGKPILWHIMKHYGHHEVQEFYVALGYRGEVVKRYFLEYYQLNADVTIDLASGRPEVHERDFDDWTVHMVDTGLDTQTGGRVKRLAPSMTDGTFMVTYGDGVSDLDIGRLVSFHRQHGRIATVTAVRPPARFGGLIFDGDEVVEFTEKPQVGEGWINGGFMVFEAGLFDYLDDDATSLENDALERLATDRQLMAYRHEGYWQCVDTLRDLRLVEALWRSGAPPWKVWD